uniref:Uncharacterized protein n=1 Tax=Arundo donax TaxID=35708 RepID=A0A0A9EKJ5_ARUDO
MPSKPEEVQLLAGVELLQLDPSDLQATGDFRTLLCESTSLPFPRQSFSSRVDWCCDWICSPGCGARTGWNLRHATKEAGSEAYLHQQSFCVMGINGRRYW